MPGVTIGGNGSVELLDAPYDLGELLFEQQPVIATIHGERRTFLGWVVKDENYPRRLQARLDRARRKYMRVADPLAELPKITAEPGTPEHDAQIAARDEALEDPDIAEAMEQADEAWQEYVTTAISILVPDLPYDMAEVIHTEKAVGLLEELGYFPKKKDATAGQRKEASGGDAAPLTGTTPQPDSPTSTPDSILSGSST